ncbi:hypothetical protein HELRODRAFT_164411 [Helobdella robusta]|uniref:Uncharacterized protein n=1 Tax=Helobdella robusta TaxID=6412 RepID=T1EVE1_HELRO|nr:hypothetical protein HELRODRAFT_164411 [Helobdella robusta]ESN94552.1 hypothetical protein HELRODRAFT_164411 [Helobdella robusta]
MPIESWNHASPRRLLSNGIQTTNSGPQEDEDEICSIRLEVIEITLHTWPDGYQGEVNYLQEQHFLCQFNELTESQVTYNPQVIEQFLKMMRFNVPTDQLFFPDKLMSAIQQIYNFIFTQQT